MTDSDTTRRLDMLDAGANTGGCGCGSCGCGSTTSESSSEESRTTADTSQHFAVTGMTCGHCASAVIGELNALDGVTDVQVDVVAGGTSTVTVSSRTPLEHHQVATALSEAGDYQLA